ncbi:MAG: SDR family oxidoreductase [Bacteroidetes bacterium CHB5]|nr:SDR family oxidoreductase [Bacteroidetes bacterium CHB5]
MDLHLKNKVVVVTGGARGIGKAIVELLKEEGAKVAIVDKIAQTISTLPDRSLKGTYFTANLADAETCKKVVEDIVAELGPIDALVNNAGFNDNIGLQSGTPEKFIESLTNNVGHYYFMTHYCLQYLKERRGAIVNLGSKTSVTGQGNSSGYVAAKGAILSLTREWAVELLPYSVRVNAVIPAEVSTPLYESWLKGFSDPQEKLRQVSKKIPFEQRLTKPEEIAQAVAFLLSDCSSHTTGQWFFVDGGYTHLDRAIS